MHCGTAILLGRGCSASGFLRQAVISTCSQVLASQQGPQLRTTPCSLETLSADLPALAAPKLARIGGTKKKLQAAPVLYYWLGLGSWVLGPRGSGLCLLRGFLIHDKAFAEESCFSPGWGPVYARARWASGRNETEKTSKDRAQ